jgi:hypothetical protein
MECLVAWFPTVFSVADHKSLSVLCETKVMQLDEKAPDAMEPPPFLKTWARVYSGVLGYLALMLAILYALTKAFKY